MKLGWKKRPKDPDMSTTLVIDGQKAWCKNCNTEASTLGGGCSGPGGCGKPFTKVTTPLNLNAASVRHYRPDLKWENF